MTESKSRIAVNTIITFVTFVIEAILHYNIGKTGRISFRYLPGRKDLWRIAVVVAFFSVISEAVSILVNRLFPEQTMTTSST